MTYINEDKLLESIGKYEDDDGNIQFEEGDVDEEESQEGTQAWK